MPTVAWSAPRRRDLTARMAQCLISRPPCCALRLAPPRTWVHGVCLRAAHKSETYRSLRSLKAAALVPSAGTSKLQTELRSARVYVYPIPYVRARCWRRVRCDDWGPTREHPQMWFDIQTWLPIVSVTLAAAICLSVASFIMGSTKLPPVGA
jgi:hypothetical protein